MLQVFEYIVLIVFHFLIFSFRIGASDVFGICERDRKSGDFRENSLFSESDRKKNVPKTYKLIDKGI